MQYTSIDVRTWATWDHYPICARRRDEEQLKNFPNGKRKKKWTEWKPKTDEQTIEFRKKVTEKKDDTEDDLATVQRNIDTAAGEVAHHTRAERETF